MHLTDLELFQIHTETLFVHDVHDCILSDNEPDGKVAPRVFVGHTRKGTLRRFRCGLSRDLARRLTGLLDHESADRDLREAPRHLAALQEILGNHPDAEPDYFGPMYRFPETLPLASNVTRIARGNMDLLHSLPAYHADIMSTFEVREPIFVVVRGGVAVSLCFSSRLTERAAEAGVETLEGYRGRGYAASVVAAWAHAVRATGRMPFYGTTWGNLASQGVARRLGLVLFGTDMSLA